MRNVEDLNDGRVACWRTRADGPPVAWTRRVWGSIWARDNGVGDEADMLRWLLRTDEVRARREWYERGAAEARAAIVAWLRAQRRSDWPATVGAQPIHALQDAAERIERGEAAGPDGGPKPRE